MAEDREKLHAREKVVQQMSRDGLVEENLVRGTIQKASSRQADYELSREGQTTQAHDRSQNRIYYQAADHGTGAGLQTETMTVPENTVSSGNAPGASLKTGGMPAADETEGIADSMEEIPVPLPEDFAGFAGRMAQINGKAEKESGLYGDALEKAGRLMDNKNRKLKNAIRKEEHRRQSVYREEEKDGEEDGEEDREEDKEEDRTGDGQGNKPEEKKKEKSGRLKEDRQEPLKFQKNRKTEEAAERLRKRGKRLQFDDEEEEEKEGSGTGKGRRRETEKKQEKEEDTEEEEKEESGGRLKFEEDDRRDSLKGRAARAAGRKALRRFLEEQEDGLDSGAYSAWQMGKWSLRGAAYAGRKSRLRKMRAQTWKEAGGRLKERGEEQQENALGESVRERRRLQERSAAPARLKSGSRYLKNQEKQKQDMKKAYQRKINMKKSMETAQNAGKSSFTAKTAKKAAAKAAAAVKRFLLPVSASLLAVLLILFIAGYLLLEFIHMGEAGIGAIYGGLYQSTYSDMTDCEGYYRELEADLEEMIADINKENETYQDCYEFVYDLGDVGHRAVDLMSYLAVKYTDFTLEMCKDELDSLFEEMYTLEVEVKEEERDVEKTDADGNIIYDADNNPVTERKEVKICYVTLVVKPWDEIMEGRLTPGEAERYGVYLMSQGGQQVYGNPLLEDWKDKISSPFGYRIHPITKVKTLHAGIDIAVPVGTPLFSSTDGTVVTARYSESAGNFIEVLTESGYTVRYMHLDSLGVSVGETVEKGMLIGATGNTGNSTGPHLHLEVRTPEWDPIDPTFIIANGEGREETGE